MLLLMEAQGTEPYVLTDEERAAIQVGLEQARRGEFASDEEMEALWKGVSNPTKSLKEVLAGDEPIPDEVLDRLAAERSDYQEKLRELRAEIELGIRQLDAGEGRPLDIEEFVREMHERHRKR